MPNMKVQKTIQRGTAKLVTEFVPLKWGGSGFRKHQSETMDKGNPETVLVTSRGQKTIRLDQRPKSEIKDATTEITLVAGRGTGTRKIKIINN